MSVPRVSVVLPTYNRDYCLARSIDSVLGQTFRDFELLVLDDGSTDDTIAALRPYADRIRLIRQRNAGGAAARNRGMDPEGALRRHALRVMQDVEAVSS